MRIREPKFTVTVQVTDGKKSFKHTYEGEKPKELMDHYKNLIGDGNAGVSVSTDISLKSFGSGVSAMVTVSLTCDQSLNGINAAAELAAQAARHYAKRFQKEGEQELRGQLEAEGRKVEF